MRIVMFFGFNICVIDGDCVVVDNESILNCREWSCIWIL